MKRLRRKIEDIMSAAAFAEEGEFETAREMLKGRKRVLLVLTGREDDRKAFKYALNISKRIGAGIVALQVTSGREAPGLLSEFESGARSEGVEFEKVARNGCIKKEVLDYTEERADIQFVVVESEKVLDRDCMSEERGLVGLWKRLRCPMVLVSETQA